MMETTKEAFENNLQHYESMETIFRIYLNKHECSVLSHFVTCDLNLSSEEFLQQYI